MGPHPSANHCAPNEIQFLELKSANTHRPQGENPLVQQFIPLCLPRLLRLRDLNAGHTKEGGKAAPSLLPSSISLLPCAIQLLLNGRR